MNHPVSSLFQLGGLFFVMCYGESRRRTHLCEACGKTTDSHTALSVFFLIPFILQLILVAVSLIAWLVMFVLFILFY